MALFVCKECGFGSASWIGKCPDCGKWNTLVERDFDKESTSGKKSKEKTKKLEFVSFAKIAPNKKNRLHTGIFEFDRVLGGGFIPGSVTLLTGEPGVGKSTLLLQALSQIKTLYISGEESADQVKDRAERLGIQLNNLSFSDTTQVEGIIEGLEDLKEVVQIVVIDSIQTIYSKQADSAAGSVNQLKEVAKQFIMFAKKNNIPVILIGHITKVGDVAGPKTLEHLVDSVLNFEGEKVSNFRILRASKNRFGGSDEIGIFEMKDKGLKEVKSSLAFLDHDESIQTAGRAIVGVAEGKRPLFFEIQTLAVPTILPVPRRVVRGIDFNKVQLILAVLRKNLGLSNLDKYDIYVNVVGGVSIKSTASDLGIAASLVSSLNNTPLPKNSVFIGEVGLLGEVRSVYLEERILKEAKRLQFKKIISISTIKHIKELKRVISI